MDTGYIQNLRAKLRRRVQRVHSENYKVYHSSLRQLWGFLESTPIFAGVLEYLERRFPDFEQKVYDIGFVQEFIGAGLSETELEYAAFSYFTLKKCVKTSGDEPFELFGMLSPEDFNLLFLEPFYQYLDEQITDQAVTLSLLERYKERCEWFLRDDLHVHWEADPVRAPWNLGLNLYGYLHDQGFPVRFKSDLSSHDLLAVQEGGTLIPVDSMVFDGDLDVISTTFGRLHRFVLEHNEPFGFLAIYKVHPGVLNVSLPEKAGKFPFTTISGRTIFLVVIDISPVDTMVEPERPCIITKDLLQT